MVFSSYSMARTKVTFRRFAMAQPSTTPPDSPSSTSPTGSSRSPTLSPSRRVTESTLTPSSISDFESFFDYSDFESFFDYSEFESFFDYSDFESFSSCY